MARIQNKTVNPTTQKQVITPDPGYDYLGTVTVNAMKLQVDASVTSNDSKDQTVIPSWGNIGIKKITVNGIPLKSNLTIDGEMEVRYFTGPFGSVTVNPMVYRGENYIGGRPTYPVYDYPWTLVTAPEGEWGDYNMGIKDFNYDKIDQAKFNIKPENIACGVEIFGVKGTFVNLLQSKEATPTYQEQTIYPDTPYYGLSSLKVNKIDISNLDPSLIRKGYRIEGVVGSRKSTYYVDDDDVNKVRFFDFKNLKGLGSVLGYTRENFLQLGQMPEPLNAPDAYMFDENFNNFTPIFQGWNWDYDSASLYVGRNPGGLDIGGLYGTPDGATYINFIQKNVPSSMQYSYSITVTLYFERYETNNLYINWGDGNIQQVSGEFDVSHTYPGVFSNTKRCVKLYTTTDDGKYAFTGVRITSTDTTDTQKVIQNYRIHVGSRLKGNGEYDNTYYPTGFVAYADKTHNTALPDFIACDKHITNMDDGYDMSVNADRLVFPFNFYPNLINCKNLLNVSISCNPGSDLGSMTIIDCPYLDAIRFGLYNIDKEDSQLWKDYKVIIYNTGVKQVDLSRIGVFSRKGNICVNSNPILTHLRIGSADRWTKYGESVSGIANNPNLTSLVLPANTSSVDLSMKGNNTKHYQLKCFAKTPPVNYGAISFAADASIFVPSESVELYKAANGWKKYKEQIYPMQ